MDLMTKISPGRKSFFTLFIVTFLIFAFMAITNFGDSGSIALGTYKIDIGTLHPPFKTSNQSAEPAINVSSKYEFNQPKNSTEFLNETGLLNGTDVARSKYIKEKKGNPSEKLVTETSYDTGLQEIQKKTKQSKDINIMEQYRCKCQMENRSNERKKLMEEIIQVNPLFNKSSEYILTSKHPNLPLEIMKSKKSCSSLPELHSLDWNANYFQIFISKRRVKYSLYSAFYDARLETENAPVVHILTLKNSPKTDELFCNIWFSADEAPIAVNVSKFQHVDYQSLDEDRLLPFLLTCQIPGKDMRVPVAVSIADERCGTYTNILKVFGSENRNYENSVETKPNGDTLWRVGVCGPALYYFFNDISKRLVDWIETLKAIGVSKVFLYETDIHPNIDKVLRYYEAENFVETTFFSYPEPYINDPNLRRYWTNMNRRGMFAIENIYFTDCVLRQKDNFRFLAHVDPDEMVIIEDGKSFPELMQALLKKNVLPNNPAAYSLLSTYYSENLPPGPAASHLPEYLYIMRHSLHFKDMEKHASPGYTKSIYDTDYAEGVFSHRVLFCNKDPCRLKSKIVSTSMAHIAHIRRTCDDDCQKKEAFVETDALLKHEKTVQRNVKKVLTTLGLL